MDGQARIMWNFMETAFKTGALDQFLRLSHALTDKKYDVQYNIYEELEDYFINLDDMKLLEDNFDKMYGILEALTDEEVLEGLGSLVSLINPWVEGIMAAAGQDMTSLDEMKKKLVETLPKVKKALIAIGGIIASSLTKSINNRSIQEYGNRMGSLLSQSARFINDLETRDDAPVSKFMSAVFNSVDKKEIGKMTDTLTHAFLDQKPNLIKWTTAMMMQRAKKRFLKRA
ncbi:MAG: hypothetical protein KJ737_20825 [Proteobacteria bacterium]|nr:hypothetical protein [Pseudomonadota bacterium]